MPQHHPSQSTVAQPPMRPRGPADPDNLYARRPQPRTLGRPGGRLDRLDAAVHAWLVAHSILLLRVSLGAVFLAFGVLKLFPGVSPAESLVKATTAHLTFGLVPGPVALAAIGTVECTIGLCLLSGRAMRVAIYLLAILLVGILSPVVVLAPRLFSGPHHAPTLEGQYVLKDIILAAAALVLASTLRGGRLIRARRMPRRAMRHDTRGQNLGSAAVFQGAGVDAESPGVGCQPAQGARPGGADAPDGHVERPADLLVARGRIGEEHAQETLLARSQSGNADS
jgi:putative oxidoreductase